MKKRKTLVLALVILVTIANRTANADTTFTFQGELKQNGSLAAGSFNMDFSLWDMASAGSQIGVTQSLVGVVVTDGKFTVQLDFGLGAFNNPCWLEIVVDGTNLSPRTPITSAPVAARLNGTTVDPITGFIGINHDTPNARLHVFDQNDRALYVQSYGSNAIQAEVTAPATYGLRATANNGGANGVLGEVIGTPGVGVGVLGRCFADQGTAVMGLALNDIGFTNGVVGIASSDLGYGVYGENEEGGFAGYFEGDGYFSQRLHIGTESPVTLASYLNVRTPAPDNIYGGMYIDTEGTFGWPFYGYATGGVARMWTYCEGGTGDWHVYNVGNRLTVEASGEVGINETNPAYTLEVNGSAGKPGGGSWTNSSDVRLKKNIANLDGALDSVLQLRGVTFEYKDPEAINELRGQRIGLIAQEVEEVFPDWVDQRGDGYKTVTFRGFEALAIEALREMRSENQSRIENLKDEHAAQIKSLRSEHNSQINELHQRMAKLEQLVLDLNSN